MSNNSFKDVNQLSGNDGMVWWNDRPLYELEEFSLKVSTQRSDVQFIGEMGVGSKVTGYKGDGSMTIKKIWSMNFADYLTEFKAGRDPRSVIIGKLGGEDAYNGQSERISVGDVWLSELQLMNIKSGSLTADIPFGFNPDSVSYLDQIEA